MSIFSFLNRLVFIFVVVLFNYSFASYFDETMKMTKDLVDTVKQTSKEYSKKESSNNQNSEYSKEDINYYKQTNIKLQDRIKKLEYKIDDYEAKASLLKDRIRDLEYKLQRQSLEFSKSKKDKIACYLKNKDGTFMGKADTKIEAQAIAIKNCEDKSGSFWCKERNLKCSN